MSPRSSLPSSYLKSLLIITLALPLAVNAFFPTALFTVAGLFGTSHETITLEALSTVFKDFYPNLHKDASIELAFEDIADANARVDVDEQFSAPAHFDGESFPEGQARLQKLRKDIKERVEREEWDEARDALGAALHSIQDFYSHTNWVELGNKRVNRNLGRNIVIERLPKSAKTCNQCKSRAFSLFTSLPRKLDVKCANACKIDGDSPIAQAATIACAFVCVSPDCDDNLSQHRRLTSGYFSDEKGFEKPGPHKCSHGGPFDNDAEGLEGINKDTSSSTFSPHSDWHEDAVRLAREASILFVKDLYHEDKLTLEQLGRILGIKDFKPKLKPRSVDDELWLSSFRFLEPNGRPGHMGYFPVTNLTHSLRKRSENDGKSNAAHGNLIVVARLSAAIDTPDFDIRDEEGNKIFGKEGLEWHHGRGSNDGVPENVFYANADEWADKILQLEEGRGEVDVTVRGRWHGHKFSKERKVKAFVRREGAHVHRH